MAPLDSKDKQHPAIREAGPPEKEKRGLSARAPIPRSEAVEVARRLERDFYRQPVGRASEMGRGSGGPRREQAAKGGRGFGGDRVVARDPQFEKSREEVRAESEGWLTCLLGAHSPK